MNRDRLTLWWRTMLIIILIGALVTAFIDIRVAVIIWIISTILLVVLRQWFARILAKQWAAQYPARRDAWMKQLREDPEMAARMVGGEFYTSKDNEHA